MRLAISTKILLYRILSTESMLCLVRAILFCCQPFSCRGFGEQHSTTDFLNRQREHIQVDILPRRYEIGGQRTLGA
ncbi:hypothetical protein BJX96DRAFT_155991 [Aspergillus floccosus]